MLKYNVFYNKGNEALQTGETLTINEQTVEMTQASWLVKSRTETPVCEPLPKHLQH